MNKYKVFFIPYAGSSAYVYYKWKDLFAPHIEPVFVELAGRGGRSEESFYNTMEEGAEDIASVIGRQLKPDEDYIIYGHSMGSILAFETYYRLNDKKLRLPRHIFFSGKNAPQAHENHEKVHKYEDERFLTIAALYGGLPNEFYNEEVKKMFLPILRADFRLLDNYNYKRKGRKINCDITVLFGEKDFSTQMMNLIKWETHAGKSFHIYKFSGEHFFIHEEYPRIAKLIAGACS